MKNKIGKISSIINIISVLAFAICMLIPFDFGSYFVCMFLALSFIMMIASFESECNENNKVAGKIASILSSIYATLILIVYFTQCTTVMNETLNSQATRILDYKYMGLLFNLDLLGYGIMALSTFFIGLTIHSKNKIDKCLKILLIIHGIFFIGCFIMPMTGVFADSDGSASKGGIIALEFWCLYFIPIGILSYLHFKNNKSGDELQIKSKNMVKSNIKKEFNCNIEKLWDIITDNTNYAWRSDLSKIEIVDDNHFTEYAKNNFATYFTITSKQKCKEYKFDMENANMTGKWTGLFKELPDGNVELDFTEEVITNNLLMKLLAKPYLKSMQKRYIRDLEKEINK